MQGAQPYVADGRNTLARLASISQQGEPCHVLRKDTFGQLTLRSSGVLKGRPTYG